MIIVTGSVDALPETAMEVFRLSLEHVHRSRAEPGCVSHDVFVSGESEHRFFFFERWADRAALATHFAVPESRAFAKVLGKLCAVPPNMTVYEAAAVTL